MITAIDTSVLIAIYNGEATAEAWIDLLADARSNGALQICNVVAAEFFAVLMEGDVFEAFISDLGVSICDTSQQAACEAGRIFRHYRDNGGPRTNLIPDFLIGAHAMVDCDCLASFDRGYLRRYFPELPLIAP